MCRAPNLEDKGKIRQYNFINVQQMTKRKVKERSIGPARTNINTIL
jgi:hypothetical protein